MLPEEPVEFFAREPGELGIPECDDMSISGAPGNQPHLAHGVTGHDTTDETAIASLRWSKHAKTSAQYNIERIRRIAGAEQRGPAG
jgi:hypothetical protein